MTEPRAPYLRLAFLAMFVMGGCGSGESERRKQAERASWVATAELVVSQWSEGIVPKRFTASVLDRARQELERGDADAAAAAVARARAAVDRDDDAGARAVLERARR
jgi:hypothetical protein